MFQSVCCFEFQEGYNGDHVWLPLEWTATNSGPYLVGPYKSDKTGGGKEHSACTCRYLSSCLCSFVCLCSYKVCFLSLQSRPSNENVLVHLKDHWKESSRIRTTLVVDCSRGFLHSQILCTMGATKMKKTVRHLVVKTIWKFTPKYVIKTRATPVNS